jgi:molybdenum cofactor cytidylyltransferase
MDESIVVLAAGASTRFGSPKQLFAWNGTPLIRHVVQQATQTHADTIVVTGSYAEAVGQALDGLPCRVVKCSHWHRGPGASLKEALPLASKSGLLVTLGDLPLVETHHLLALLQTPGDLVAASYEQVIGAPAVFRGWALGALASIDDAAGAKTVLRAFSSHVKSIHLPEAAYDLDTAPSRTGSTYPDLVSKNASPRE